MGREDYFPSFARSGSPNADSAQPVQWPRYNPGDDNFLLLQTPEPAVVSQFATTHHIEFWDTFYA